MNSSTERPATANGIREAWSSALGARLRGGISLNLAATVFNQGSTFAASLVLANLLGRERFGEYTMVLTTVATVGTLGQLSMGYTATKFLAEFRSADPRRASRVLALCAANSAVAAPLAALCLGLPAERLASSVLRAPHLAEELRLAALAVLFVVLNGFLTGVLAGLEAYRSLARGGIASGTIYFVLCSVLAWKGGLSGALLGVASSAAAQFCILLVLTRRVTSRLNVRAEWAGWWNERSVLNTFALPASATGLLTLPSLWLASAALAWQLNGFDQLALFGAATSFRTMVLFLPQTINSVGMSVLNHERGRPNHYSRVFWMNAGMTVSAAIGGAAVLLIAGPWLLRLFGREFAAAYPVLSLLVGTAVIEAMALAMYQVVVSHGRMWLSFWFIALPRDAALVATAMLLAPAWGAAGLATAHLLAQVVGLTSTFLIVKRLGLAALPLPSIAGGNAAQERPL